MILRVGPFLYRVVFVDGYIDHDGQRCLGLCDNDAHEIQVSKVTNLAQQIQVICHEYIEAWLFHFGQNLRDKEDYCDLFGMAMTQIILDLTHQMHGFAEAGEMVPYTPVDSLLKDAAQPCQPIDDGQDSPPAEAPDASASEDDDQANIATKLAAKVAQVGLQAVRQFPSTAGMRTGGNTVVKREVGSTA